MSCDEYNAVLHKDAGIAILEMTLAAEAEYAERSQKQVVSPDHVGQRAMSWLCHRGSCVVAHVVFGLW